MQIKILDGYCEFKEDSTIQFYDKKDNLILQFDPTDLSAIYGAYRQMIKEGLEDKAIKEATKNDVSYLKLLST